MGLAAARRGTSAATRTVLTATILMEGVVGKNVWERSKAAKFEHEFSATK
jgi:hypothetical protein